MEEVPNEDTIENEIWKYSTKLLNEWRYPLEDVSEKRFFDKTYQVRWGTEYNIEAMLEHAVMHPIRHEYQLKNLIKNQT